MKYIQLHHTNLKKEISVIGFGAMGISEFYGSTDFTAAKDTINLALTSGINHFDTADGYGYGDNERALGNFLELDNPEKRNQLVISTKAGILRDKEDPSIRGISIDPEYIKKQIQQSLINLKTEYLDIFYIHRLPPNATEGELYKLGEALLELKQAGIIKAIGLSEPRLEQLQILHKLCSISVIQSEYNLLERFVEHNGTLDFCQKNNILFVAYSPLCRGLLTDSFNPENLDDGDFRSTLPKFQGENFNFNSKIILKLKEISMSLDVELSTLAIGWLLKQGVAVIPGMRKPERLKPILDGLDVVLSENILEKIDVIAAYNSTKGLRYTEAAMNAYGFDMD